MTALRIFISSPGDVAQERAIARRVLGRVQAASGGRLRLVPLVWEQQPLLASASFQAQIDRPSSADVVIAVLWSRLGTPLPDSIRRADGSSYRSGTEFELEDALAAARAGGRPKVLLYRKTADSGRWFGSAAVALEAARQREALQGFLDGLLRDRSDGSFQGAFHSFASPAEFEELLEQHLHRLLAELAPEASAAVAEPAVTAWAFGSPFRGLLSFEFEHAALYFGRTAVTALAIERLQEQARRGRAFLLLLGTSGGGKSSLAKAGILPMLMQEGVVEGAGDWRRAVCRPTDGQGDLVAALAAALTGPDGLPNLGGVDALAARLREQPHAAATLVGEALEAFGPGAQLALVVDQLEEMFGEPAAAPAERARFVDLLDRLARGGRVWIVATLRADFYPRCSELPTLLALKEGAGQLDLQAPSAAELAQMIRQPAAAAGLRFDVDPETGERLDERLRDLGAAQPGALPLLQFTLEELYRQRRPDGLLDFQSYARIGGLEGALAHRAELLYGELPADVQAALPRVFERLVVVGEEDGRVLGRRAPLASFAAGAERELVEALVAARLLVTQLDGDGEAQVGVAHEALFRHWPRLVGWMAANLELLRIRSRVRESAERWMREQRREEFLLAQGKPHAEGLQLRESGMPLEPLEAEYLAASERRVRRARNLRRGAAGGLLVLALAASAAAMVAVRQADVARREAITASRTSDFLASLFAVADPGESRGSAVTARELLDRGARQIRDELRDEPLVRAQLINTMGVAYSGLGLYEPAATLTAEALAARLAQLGPLHPDTLRSRLAHATVLSQSAKYEEAATEFLAVRAAALQARPGGSLERTRATLGLAEVYSFDDDPARGEALFREALVELEQLPGDLRRERVFALSGLGTALYFQSRLDEADAAFRAALDLADEALGGRHPKLAELVNNLGSVAYQQGDYARAARLFERALPLYRAVFGAEHPEVATVLNNLGRVALLARDFERAELALTESLAIERARRTATHDNLIIPLNSLGLARAGRRDLDGAEAALRESLAIALEHQHWMEGVVRTGLADLALRDQRSAEAGVQLRAARAALERSFPPETRADEGWRFTVLDSVEGRLLLAGGELDAAAPKLLDSIEPLAERFGERSLFAVDAMERAADYYARRGDREGLEALQRRLRKATGAG